MKTSFTPEQLIIEPFVKFYMKCDDNRQDPLLTNTSNVRAFITLFLILIQS